MTLRPLDRQRLLAVTWMGEREEPVIFSAVLTTSLQRLSVSSTALLLSTRRDAAGQDALDERTTSCEHCR